MLCGHLDVVGAAPSAFEPVVRDGRIHGRGTIDMKGGLAAAVVAAERLAANGSRPAGDLIVAAVIDEEWASAGAEALVRHHRADAAILPEQSELDIIVEHGGFAWFEVESRGRESAGIEPELGIDAIELAIPLLEGVVALDRELATRPAMPYGRSSVHVSTVSGGTSFPVYPASCVLGIERCTLPAETVAQAQEEMRELLLRAHEADPRFDGELRTVIAREAAQLDADHVILRALDDAIAARLGRPARHIGDMGWADSGLLAEAGVPCAMFGPSGGGHHSADEWVEIASVIACADILEATARAFCAAQPASAS
jgi:acetylornithine deacetylase